jgi:TolB protein
MLAELAAVATSAFGLGSGNLDGDVGHRFAPFGLVVIDGGEATAAQVAALRGNGKVVLGYLSVGTIEPYRSYYRRLKPYRLPQRFEAFDEFYANVGAPGFRREIVGRIAPRILRKGFDGLFLDNVDMIEQFRRQRRGMLTLVRALDALVGERALFAQNGDDIIEPFIAHLDGWNRESPTRTYDFDRRRYVPTPAPDSAAALATVRRLRERGLLVTTTDYTRAGDASAESEALTNACAAGAVPFVSNISLRRIPATAYRCEQPPASAAVSRGDGATRIDISGLRGSLQNPCFSPAGDRLAITQWTRRYNGGPAVVHVVGLGGGAPLARVSPAGGASVNLPGSCWNAPTGLITFSAEIDGPDAVHVVAPDGSGLRRVFGRRRDVTVEPSFSPDGQRIVFESSTYDANDPTHEIWVVGIDGTGARRLSGGRTDDRQPNWSPAGDRIVFQRRRGDVWDLHTINPDGSGRRNVTRTRRRSETDAAWSPDGTRLVFSSDGPGVDIASLFTIGADGTGRRRVTRARGTYDGAPSWSPDGTTIAFESRRGDPDGSAGTRIWTIRVPA